MTMRFFIRGIASILIAMLFSGCTAHLHLKKEKLNELKVNDLLKDGKKIEVLTDKRQIRVDVAYFHHGTLFYLEDGKFYELPIDHLQKIKMRNYKYGRNAGIATGIIFGVPAFLVISRIASSDVEQSRSDVVGVPDITPVFYVFGGMVLGGISGAIIGSNLRSKLVLHFD
jgi:hypothetical protein